MTEGKNRIMIFGPKADGTYVKSSGLPRARRWRSSVPQGETAVLQHFQARMPYGLFVPDI
jgi:hypothetical protein